MSSGSYNTSLVLEDEIDVSIPRAVDPVLSTEDLISIVVPVTFSFVVAIGFFGNLLVVLVVAFNRQMRNTTNLLILNLATADILFLIFCIPPTATTYAQPRYWPFGDAGCKMVQFVIVVTAYISIYTLVLMSLDRFLAVVFPIESLVWRNIVYCKRAIVCMWITICVACLPLLVANGQIHIYLTSDDTHEEPIVEFQTDNSTSQKGNTSDQLISSTHDENENDTGEHYMQNELAIYCNFLDNTTVPYVPGNLKFSYKFFQISFFVTAYIVPLGLISGMYSVMLHRLWTSHRPGQRTSKDVDHNHHDTNKQGSSTISIAGGGDGGKANNLNKSSKSSVESTRHKRRVVRMVLIVIVVFALSWLPINIILVMRSLKIYENTPILIALQILSQILAYANSCVNPILYAFLSEPFRRGFGSLIKCIRPSGPHGQREIDLKKTRNTATTNVCRVEHGGNESLELSKGKLVPHKDVKAQRLSVERVP